MIFHRGTCHPSLGTVRKFVLKIFNLGPPPRPDCLLLLLAACWPERVVHPRPFPAYVNQPADVAQSCLPTGEKCHPLLGCFPPGPDAMPRGKGKGRYYSRDNEKTDAMLIQGVPSTLESGQQGGRGCAGRPGRQHSVGQGTMLHI